MQLHNKVVIERAEKQSQHRIPTPLNDLHSSTQTWCKQKKPPMQVSCSWAQDDILRTQYCPYHGLEFHCFSHWAKISS